MRTERRKRRAIIFTSCLLSSSFQELLHKESLKRERERGERREKGGEKNLRERDKFSSFKTNFCFFSGPSKNHSLPFLSFRICTEVITFSSSSYPLSLLLSHRKNCYKLIFCFKILFLFLLSSLFLLLPSDVNLMFMQHIGIGSDCPDPWVGSPVQ